MCSSKFTMRKGDNHHCFAQSACVAGNALVSKQRLAKATCTAERTTAKYRRNSRKCIKKSVRFDGKVKVCLKPVSREELNDTWYGPLEYKNFQKDSKRSLKAVTSNLRGQIDAYDSSQHCLRGLEACISSQVYQLRKDEKSNIVNEVLNHQLLQRLLGMNNPEHLASLSQGLSKQAQQRALLLAALDAHRDHQDCLAATNSSGDSSSSSSSSLASS